ncbi:hypothetical protein [Streptomyces sp. NPDC089799]|uniref:hypothetical protein n=1 Tax=Streptomyces sp. NPDC089799 TaxID=3155066 RepID=UPI003413E143
MAGTGRGEVFADLAEDGTAQRHRPADRMQPTLLVAAAVDEELRVGPALLEAPAVFAIGVRWSGAEARFAFPVPALAPGAVED